MNEDNQITNTPCVSVKKKTGRLKDKVSYSSKKDNSLSFAKASSGKYTTLGNTYKSGRVFWDSECANNPSVLFERAVDWIVPSIKVSFVISGEFNNNTEKTFYIYFDTLENGRKPFPSYYGNISISGVENNYLVEGLDYSANLSNTNEHLLRIEKVFNQSIPELYSSDLINIKKENNFLNQTNTSLWEITLKEQGPVYSKFLVNYSFVWNSEEYYLERYFTFYNKTSLYTDEIYLRNNK